MEPQKKYPNLLKLELEQEQAKIDEQLKLLRLKLETINSRYDVLRRLYAADRLPASEKYMISACWQDAGGFTHDINELNKRKERIAEQRKQVINRDADSLYEQALKVGEKTGKNKLYIGSRQFVA